MINLVIAPHPDDEVLGLGGTIFKKKSKGEKFGVIYVTSMFPSKSWNKKKIISVAGWGDTISALKKNKKFNNFSYLSTGGGAFLSWLEDYSLVGIDVLKN